MVGGTASEPGSRGSPGSTRAEASCPPADGTVTAHASLSCVPAPGGKRLPTIGGEYACRAVSAYQPRVAASVRPRGGSAQGFSRATLQQCDAPLAKRAGE